MAAVDTILAFVTERANDCFRVFGSDEIVSLPKKCQLEVFKNFADEVRPALFHDTDIGRLIDDHIDILSFALTKFLLSAVTPTNNSIDVQFDVNDWIFELTFNQHLKAGQDLPMLLAMSKRVSISNLTVSKMRDQIYFDSDLMEYFIVAEWRLDWESTGVRGVNVSYQIDSEDPVLLKADHNNSWINFPFIPGREEFSTIRFFLVDSDHPEVMCESLTFDGSGNSSGTETRTETILTVADVVYSTDSSGTGDVVRVSYKDDLPTHPLRPKDEYSLTISDELLDERDIAFNDSLAQTVKYATNDYLRVIFVSAENNILSDPNVVTIKFNREISTVQYLYEGSEDGVVFNTLSSRVRIVGDTATISTELDSDLFYHRLTLVTATDTNGVFMEETGEVINFVSNHGVVYHDGNFVIDEDGKIVMLNPGFESPIMFFGFDITPPVESNNSLMFFGDEI